MAEQKSLAGLKRSITPLSIEELHPVRTQIHKLRVLADLAKMQMGGDTQDETITSSLPRVVHPDPAVPEPARVPDASTMDILSLVAGNDPDPDRKARAFSNYMNRP